MSTNVEALTPRSPGWLCHGHLDRVMILSLVRFARCFITGPLTGLARE
jgi:hypothetical protein